MYFIELGFSVLRCISKCIGVLADLCCRQAATALIIELKEYSRLVCHLSGL